MQAELLTCDSALYHGEISELQAQTSNGAVTILPHHEAFVAVVLPGTIKLRVKGGVKDFQIGGGLIEVRDNVLRLLAGAIDADEVEADLQIGIKRAEGLSGLIHDKQELHRAEAVVDRNSTSLGVATMKRRRNRG